MFFVDRRWRAQVAVVSGGQAQHERRHDEDNDAQFLPGQNKSLREGREI